MFYSVATKRIFAFCTLLTLLFVLAGCSHTDDTVSDGTTTTGTSTETSGSVETMGMSPTDPSPVPEVPVANADTQSEPETSNNTDTADSTNDTGSSGNSEVVDSSNNEPETPVAEDTTPETAVAEDTTVVTSSSSTTETTTSTNLFKHIFSDVRRTDVNKVLTFPVLGSNLNSAGTIRVTQQPANGTLTVGGNQLTFTPDSGTSGHSVAKVKVDWLDGNSDTATISFYTEQVKSSTYFDPANGNNSNSGSQSQPKKTGIEAALQNAGNGDRIYVKGGHTYNLRLNLKNIAGSTSAPVVLSSYGGGKAKFNYSGSKETVFLGGNIGQLVIENVVITKSNGSAILAYNKAGESIDVVLDNVDIIDSGSNGINWQTQSNSKLTLIHSDISDNEANGFIGNPTELIALNNTFLRNANTKDYSGGPMQWNAYISHADGLHYEGNINEDSEGLIKLRDVANFTIQKNTLRRGWVAGIGAGGDIHPRHGTIGKLENGVIANNLIDESQNPFVFADSDNNKGGGIHNVDVFGNAVVHAKYVGGLSRNAVISILNDAGDRNSNFRVFDNIFWADKNAGYGGARISHDDVEFFGNTIGAGSASNASGNNVFRFEKGASPDLHGNKLYKFFSDTTLGVPMSNGNTEVNSVPQEVQKVLDNI